MQQSLGLPLREIGELLAENAAGRLTPERSKTVPASAEAAQGATGTYRRMIACVMDKLAWIESGVGPAPRFDHYT